MKTTCLSTCRSCMECHRTSDFGTRIDVKLKFWHQNRRHSKFWHRFWRHLRIFLQNRSNFGTRFDVILCFSGSCPLFWHHFWRQNCPIPGQLVSKLNFGTDSDVISWSFIPLGEIPLCFGTNFDVKTYRMIHFSCQARELALFLTLKHRFPIVMASDCQFWHRFWRHLADFMMKPISQSLKAGLAPFSTSSD